jgi:hypothetical protein
MFHIYQQSSVCKIPKKQYQNKPEMLSKLKNNISVTRKLCVHMYVHVCVGMRNLSTLKITFLD